MNQYIISIEICSTRVTLLLATPDEQSKYGVRILHTETTVTSGVTSRGKIVQEDKVKRVVENLLFSKNIPKKKDNTFYYVFSVSGNDYRSFSQASDPVVAPGAVTNTMLSNLRTTLLTTDILSPTEVATTIYPRYYIVDSRPTVTAPIGSTADRLEALWLITSVKRDLLKHYSDFVGSEVKFVYPVASSKGLILLSPEDREKGVALVDFGLETTSIAVYYKGILQGECTLPLGGRSITMDILHGLQNRNAEEAEQLKRLFGIEPNEEKDRTRYKIKFTDGTDTDPFLAGDVKFYARARAEEIVDYINNWINTNNTLRDRVKKFVITGGGSKLKGLDKMMVSRLNRPVEIIDSDNETCTLGMATRFVRDNKDLFLKTEPTTPEKNDTPEPPPPTNGGLKTLTSRAREGLFDRFGAVIDSLMDEKEGKF